jgi:Family of unknown function (DUF6328)
MATYPPAYDLGVTQENGADVNPFDGRDETEAERLDRNWTEILQELRVIQTGTQILTGFLLTIAFQQKFASLDSVQDVIYLALVVLAALTTALGLAPVSLHRSLFRKKAKETLVAVANRILKITLGAVAVLLSGTTLLIFSVIVGRTAGFVAGATVLVLISGTWLLLPASIRHRQKRGGVHWGERTPPQQR